MNEENVSFNDSSITWKEKQDLNQNEFCAEIPKRIEMQKNWKWKEGDGVVRDIGYDHTKERMDEEEGEEEEEAEPNGLSWRSKSKHTSRLCDYRNKNFHSIA